MRELRYTQRELAERSGYSTKHLNEVLQGKSGCSIEFLFRMRYPLGIDPHSLVEVMYIKE